MLTLLLIVVGFLNNLSRIYIMGCTYIDNNDYGQQVYCHSRCSDQRLIVDFVSYFCFFRE